MKKLLLAFLFLLPSTVFGAETISTGASISSDLAGFPYASISRTDVAQSFTTVSGGDLSTITTYLKKGSPNADLTVSLRSNNAGVPSSTSLASFTVLSSAITSSCSAIVNTATTTLALSASTLYWIVYSTTSSPDASYTVCGDSTNTYANGQFESKDAGTWKGTPDYTRDVSLSVYLTSTGGGSSTSTATTTLTEATEFMQLSLYSFLIWGIVFIGVIWLVLRFF